MTWLPELSTPLLLVSDLSTLLQEVLDATIELQGADFGHIQLYDEGSQLLKIVTHRGVGQQFLDYFESIHARDDPAFGQAFGGGGRMVIADVNNSPEYQAHRRHCRRHGLSQFAIDAAARARHGQAHDPETGKRVSRPNPLDQLISHDVPELRIIDQDLWDRAKARQAELTEAAARATAGMHGHAPWDRRRPRYLLSGLMRCGICVGGYSKISADLFGCSAARNKGTCTNRLNIRRDQIEAIVLVGLKTRLMDPELFKVFAQEFLAEVNRLRGHESAKSEQLKRELDQVEKRIRRIVEAIAEGVRARSLKDELLALEQRQEELEREIARAPKPQPLLHPNLAELDRQKVVALEQALQDPQDGAEAMEMIRSLIDALVLTPEGGKLRVDLTGALAGILSIAQNGQRPRPEDEGRASQVKLVAGARNQQYRMTASRRIPVLAA